MWGSVEETHSKIARISWDIACKPKNLGGLGIKIWGDFNQALLGKWRWRLCSNDNGLWARIIRSKYRVLTLNLGNGSPTPL